MSLTLTQTSNFTPTPEGTHAARCYQVIDIGTQKTEYPFGSGQFKFQPKLILSFETPDEKMEDGKPFIIHQEYTASLGEKAKLRLHLEGWRGRAFTKEELAKFYIGDLLGKPCLITVVHRTSGSGKTYANITNISAPVKGMTVPEAVNPLLKWEVGMGLDLLPDWIKTKAMASSELAMGDFPDNGYLPSENPAAGLSDAGYDDGISF